MTRRQFCVATLTLTAIATAAVYAANDRQAGGESIAMSAVVLDRNGQPARNLRASDFEVREDGKPVAIGAFHVTNAADTAASGRQIVLLLSGQGGDANITLRYQQIARLFFERATELDAISVVRVIDSHDEVAGSRADMLMRVAEFRAPYGEPFNKKTSETLLERLEKIADQFPRTNTARKAIVCIGPSYVFDIVEPQQRQYELLWPYWVRGLAALARANASVYVIDPKGLDYRTTLNPDGLVRQTGGTLIEDSNDFSSAVERVWRETANYYTFEYAPLDAKRELHSIDVKVKNRDLRVRARRSR